MDDPTLKVPLAGGAPIARTLPGLTLLCHADLRRIGERASLPELLQPSTVRLSRRELSFARPDTTPTGPLADPYISRTPIVFQGDGHGSVAISGAGLRINGQAAAERVCSPSDIDDGVIIEISERAVVLLHRFAPRPPTDDLGLIGSSDAICAARDAIRQVADLDVPVLIQGESGTGKELVAKALHARSRRAAAPLLSLNMGAIPPSTAASELFGHTRGAFTGAAREHDGYFLRAHQGTLFLDEIGAAPVEVQGMLLRALESGEIQPLGSRLRTVDVRLIAATDLDLEAAAEAGSFRRPLLHRLGVYQIAVPPLRARRDDIARLLVHFLQHACAACGEAPRPPEGTLWLPTRTVAELVRFSWPGNVRQLRNVAQQMVINNRGRPTLAVMPDMVQPAAPAAAPAPAPATPPPAARRALKDISDEEVLATLQQHRWRIHAAATAMGVSRASLYRLIDRNPAIQKASELDASTISAALRDCGGDASKLAAALQVSPQGLRRRMRELGLQ